MYVVSLSSMEIDSDISSGEEETLTASEVLQILEESWLNEKFSPEILPHRNEMVECMLEQINQMEENLNKLKKGDFRVIVHQMELDRIRFIITSYLRIRLSKIEEFTVHILTEESRRDHASKYLSPGEYKFATEYVRHMENHFHLLAFRHMPGNFQEFNKTKMVVVPNVSSHVFIRAKDNIATVVVDDEEIDLEENSQHVLPYSSVMEFVRSGSVQLV